MPQDDAPELRLRMVEKQIAARGVRDTRVLDAMRAVRRETFVDPRSAEAAYEDGPLPIGCGQTISQPYVVAWMAEALEIGAADRVLEVGAGSGYAAAVMGRLAAEVWAVERHPELVARARTALGAEDARNVHVVLGDGSLGLPERAPFQAISVACAANSVPAALLRQLAPGGRIVLPLAIAPDEQELTLLRPGADGSLSTRRLGAVRFVPLVGDERNRDRR